MYWYQFIPPEDAKRVVKGLSYRSPVLAAMVFPRVLNFAKTVRAALDSGISADFVTESVVECYGMTARDAASAVQFIGEFFAE
ncbi:hypothetical protein ACFCXS_25675 [Streptomyces sp. NPDC056373]|uniref:hypothetical protein n=1 Tax=Streptomyces sp. NPDC056373 TaxID=3345798 RepID=UPI0035D62F91